MKLETYFVHRNYCRSRMMHKRKCVHLFRTAADRFRHSDKETFRRESGQKCTLGRKLNKIFVNLWIPLLTSATINWSTCRYLSPCLCPCRVNKCFGSDWTEKQTLWKWNAFGKLSLYLLIINRVHRARFPQN